ncbi:MAG: tetratricopeptide repeat protein, partial [Pirellula sp.]
ENVVIMSATHTDLESWQKMERDFRDLFKQRDIDLDQLDPRQVGVMIRNHRSNAWLSDALELWIGTRGQMSTIGGPKLDAQQMQPWADAMYVADPDPVRTGIRKLIYSGGTPTVDQVESVIKGASLESQSPRALSWLATVFAIANAADRSDEIFHLAVSHYPSDFMLNYDFAYALVGQRRWPEAIRYFMRCVAIRPDVAGVWRALGNAFRENGELQRSQEALQRSIQLSPNHQPTLVDLEKTLDLLRSQSSSSKDGSAQNKPFPEPSGKKP